MSLVDDDAAGQARRIAASFLDGTSDTTFRKDFDPAETDAEAAADRVVEHWTGATKSLISACTYFGAALDAFATDPEKLQAFLTRLVARRVFLGKRRTRSAEG